MPMNGQTVGRDVALDLFTSRGLLVVEPKAITSFTSAPTTTNTASKGLDGITRFGVFPDGWSGSFDVDRMNGNLDAYWAQIEADFYNGVNILPGTIQETIQEPDGSISQYRYTGVMFDFKDAGSKAANQLVKQKLSFVAARRIRVS
ncbi:hypothetical protein J7E70_02245 [Variovorax paradoxus]|nr:hypothetical protein [Variovorax paradoxus]MBT2299274.1 hypothetical protein [Variovorax paradoxus]